MSDRDPYDDEELAEAAAALARELRAHREELERERRRGPPEPPRGPLGLPRPPTPGEVMRFADEFAIPTIIAILEANIKLLEGLRQVIRMADAGREARERGRRTGEATADRASELGRATLSRVEEALSDLQTAVEGGALPEENGEGRELLDDVRNLQDEIDRRLEETRSGPPRRSGRRRDGRGGRQGGSTGRGAGSTGRDRRGSDRGTTRRWSSERRREEGDGHRTGTTGDGADPPRGDDGERRQGDDTGAPEDDGVEVDVDAELDSLRERYREDDGDGEDDE